jgi:hypothetical protein
MSAKKPTQPKTRRWEITQIRRCFACVQRARFSARSSRSVGNNALKAEKLVNVNVAGVERWAQNDSVTCLTHRPAEADSRRHVIEAPLVQPPARILLLSADIPTRVRRHHPRRSSMSTIRADDGTSSALIVTPEVFVGTLIISIRPAIVAKALTCGSAATRRPPTSSMLKITSMSVSKYRRLGSGRWLTRH